MRERTFYEVWAHPYDGEWELIAIVKGRRLAEGFMHDLRHGFQEIEIR